jgi:hypothetical protein
MRLLNEAIVLVFMFLLYSRVRPPWLDLSAAVLIAAIVTIALWSYDAAPTKRVLTGLTWLGLLGIWIYFKPPWFSLTSLILLALLVAILFYRTKKTPPTPPHAYEIQPWDTERQKLVLEAWKQTIAVQMHFNDLELRIRNYALTLLLAAGGAASISLKEEIYFHVPGEEGQTHISVLLLSFGLLGWLGFYLMDRFWYHRLLYGAVRHGEFLEEKFGDDMSFLRLTGAIGDESSVWLLGIRIQSPRKIDVFYGLFAVLLVVAIYVVYHAKSKVV